MTNIFYYSFNSSSRVARVDGGGWNCVIGSGLHYNIAKDVKFRVELSAGDLHVLLFRENRLAHREMQEIYMGSALMQ